MAEAPLANGRVGGRRTEKIAEWVARQIVRDIHQQGLSPGSMLPSESVMLDRFGIARGSLREALRILEVNGLVTIKTGPGGGPIVTAYDSRPYGQLTTLHLQSVGATYRQLLDARVEYEAILARRCAEQPGDKAAGAVLDAVQADRRPTVDDDRYTTAASHFHAVVVEASGNPVLALTASAIQHIWAVRVSNVLFSSADRELVFDQHESIARAIERHDGRRAERLMREHMRHYQVYCDARYPARMDEVVDWG